MATQLQNLKFMVSLIDRVSGPAGKMMKTMDKVTTNIQSGYRKIGFGVAGVAGAGLALNSLIQPAKDMHTALGEVKSLDVAQKTLDKLRQTALITSSQYGISASEFVSSSFDIQSAIAGLTGNQLPAFTRAGAILAKGTKAHAATITNFMGTMFNIFEDTANGMGRSKWIEQLAGQTSQAVKMFKTTGQGMSEAFSRVGAAGQTMGVAMGEQIAILGKLQGTMSGAEAGTKYQAFLNGVGKAQDKLGLKFTDSAGRMLPMIEILGKIKGKFGDIDTVAESDLLKKAFGRKEAVDLVKLLSKDISGLGDNITEIGNIKSMDKLIQRAQAMVDPWDQAGQAVNALRIAIGGKMLAVLKPAFDAITGVSQKILEWTKSFPNLTKWLGIGVLGIVGLIAGFSLLSIIVGIASFATAGFGLVMAILTSPITAVIVGIAAIGFAIYSLLDAWAQWTFGLSIFDTMAAGFEATKLAVTDFIEIAVNGFTRFKNFLSNLDPFALIGQGIGFLIDKINLIPGINIDAGSLGLASAPRPPPSPGSGAGLGSGLGGQASSVFNQGSQNSSIGDIVINNFGSAPNAGQIRDELIFAGG